MFQLTDVTNEAKEVHL